MDVWDLLLILWIAASGACATFAARSRKKAPCDTCKWLNFKFRRGSGVYRYRCGVQGGFEKPPLYCREYERRGEGGGEDGRSTALGAGPGAAEDGGTEQEIGAGTAGVGGEQGKVPQCSDR